MSLANFCKKQLDKIAKASVDKMGDIIILTSVAGWLASSAAQLFGIAINKDYSTKEKKFMLSQEGADALINIVSYFLVTKSCTKLSSHLVKTGKLAPKSIVQLLEKNNLASRRGQYNFDVTAVDGFKKVRNDYNGLKCFADSTAALIGGVISSNVITPIARNAYASRRQNTYIEKNKKHKENTTTNQIYPKRHTFDDFRTTVLSI